MIEVTLTEEEMRLAALHGVDRRIAGLFRQRAGHNGAERDCISWSADIEACAAEMAYCKWRGIYWTGVQNFRARDAGPVEIRHTERHDGCLILHEKDGDDRPFVLVTGLAPRFVLRGGIHARDGKRQEFWKDLSGRGRPAFFVPQQALTPLKSKGREK